jgi:hypothetical protein
MSISELFSALDTKIAQQISLTRSNHPGQNPFSPQVVSSVYPLHSESRFIFQYKILKVEELDSGVNRLLCRLKELHNSKKPIQRLPPDIVIEIATYFNPRACGGDYQLLVAMSQVCHYWRRTLLSDASSWSFVSSEFIELLPLFLERSGSHLLEVNLSTDTLFSLPNTIQHIGRHADRLGILRCDLEEDNVVALQALSWLDHSPNLRTFSIKISRPPAVAPGPMEFPPFLGEMPTLHTLKLLPFPITPQIADCKHLVNLQLDVRYSTLTGVLDLLSANPLLEKVRLLGNFEDGEDARAAESIYMKYLRFFTVERCTPCSFLEKLTFPDKARVFIRYNFIPHLAPSVYTLPQPTRRYPNLQGLSSLYALTTYPNDTYIDATGPNGSIAIQYTDLQDEDGSVLLNTVAMLPTTGVTQLTCESHPAFTGIEICNVVTMMDVLPLLEEITLVHFGSADTQNFLSALANPNRWTCLRRLGFVHCRQVADWIEYFISVAAGREDEGLKLDTVNIVLKERGGAERAHTELFDVLEGFVGTLELVEEEAGDILRSAQVWDEANCTTTRVSVPMWAD